MYTQHEIQKMVFFDLETVPAYNSLDSLDLANPRMAQLWSKRCEYLRSRFEENKELTDEDLYNSKAGLTPEFARIVCATFGRITFPSDEILAGLPSLIVKSYSSTDEKIILAGINTVFTKFATQRFVGHNIKRFDVPMMCKRLLIEDIALPKGLQVQNLKPWEMPFIDTSELWSFGAWQESFTSLDLLTASLNIPTSKDDINGEEVAKVFWQEKNILRITEYCQKDVLAVAQVILKLSGLQVVEDYQLQQS